MLRGVELHSEAVGYLLKQLGTVRASNYIYLNPIFTSIGALLFLGEPLTPVALLGAACVLCVGCGLRIVWRLFGREEVGGRMNFLLV